MTAFSHDPCPVCGATTLVDARADDNDYTPPPNSDWDFTGVLFDFSLTCRACRASLSLPKVNRYYTKGKISYVYDYYSRASHQVHSIKEHDVKIASPGPFEWEDDEEAARHTALEKQLWNSSGPSQPALETLKSGTWHQQKLDHWLRAAIYYGKVTLIPPLVTLGASLDRALPWAMANRQVEAALALLAYDVNPNESLNKAFSFLGPWSAWERRTWYPLLTHIHFDFWKVGPVTLGNMLNLAVLYHAPELVERLLEKGATLEFDADQPRDGDQKMVIRLSPWSLAILTGQPELVERFWRTGPLDPGHALYCALCVGDEKITRRLLDEGVGLWETSLWAGIDSNLHAAARGGMTWTIDLWATRDPDFARNRPAEEITPLHIAARHLHPAMVRRLLEYGADPNATGLQRKGQEFKRKLMPLHEAIEPLIREGLDDSCKLNAVMEIVELLLHAGANPNVGWQWVSEIEVGGYASIWKGRFLTPLSAALRLQSPPLFDLLIRLGADVNQSVHQGDILVAALKMFIRDQDPHHFFEKLLTLGADPRTGNRYRDSPVEVARKHEREDLVQILQEQDRKVHASD